ncbi:MAG: YfiR family protein [Azoarcus sp.]|jgi:hypothetical protein|nr:YfiR family protein [Azoarcus sp.]
MRKHFFSLLAVSCGLLLFAVMVCGVQAQENKGSTAARVPSLVTIFWGIVSYTRWPEAKTPDSEAKPMRICLPAKDKRAALLSKSAVTFGPKSPVQIRDSLENAATECDILYVYNMNGDETGKLLQSLRNAPVLTIGEGNTFCSLGGMFCLLSNNMDSGGETSIDKFAANLGAISSSPLRINPQVLRLSKRGRER